MVLRGPPILLLVPLEQRHRRDPQELPRLPVDQLELAAEVQAQQAEHLGSERRRVRHEERRRPRLPKRRELLLGEELRDRRSDFAVLAEDDVGETLGAPRLGHVLELLDLGAAELARNAQVPDGLRVREHAELRAAGDLRRILDLQSETKVGLVRAEPELRLLPRHPGERRLELDTDRLAPDAGDDPLGQGEDVLLVRERQLDVELRELLQAVGAEILVPEAARDLVVALEARDHEQLLVDLR